MQTQSKYRTWLNSTKLTESLFTVKKSLTALFFAMQPTERQSPDRWADDFRTLTKGSRPGKWDSDVTPYLRGPSQDFLDDNVETIVLMWSTQVGKTAYLENIIGQTIHQNPAPMYFVLPDEAMIRDFKQEKLEDMFESSDVFYKEGRVKRASPGKSDTNDRKIRFKNGYIAFASSNSMSALAGRSIKVLILDEVDRFKVSKSEGDVILVARNRTNSYAESRKILITSTPAADAEYSRINKAFLSGDQRRFFINCPHCNHSQILNWGNVEWEKEQNADGTHTHKPETAYYRCDANGCHITHGHKSKFLKTGVWRATAKAKDRKVRSYHLNVLYSPFVSYEDVVRDYLAAKETPGGMRAFFNTQLAEVYEDPAEQAQYEEVYERAEDYTAQVLPKEIGFLTLGADVQEKGDGRLEASVWGWGRNNQRWLIEHHVIDGSYKEQATWDAFTNVRQKRYTTEDGRELSILMSLVDSSAGNTTNYVYEYCRKYRHDRVRPVKGSNRQDSGIVEVSKLENDSNGKRLKNSILLVRPNVHQFKLWLYSALQDIKDKADAYYIHTNKAAGKNWHRQLCAEKVVREVGKEQFVKTYSNEALDCAIYAHAGAQLIGINSVDWDVYFKKINEKNGIAEEIKEEEEPVETIQMVEIEVLKRIQLSNKWYEPGAIIEVSEEESKRLCDGAIQFAHLTSKPPRETAKPQATQQKKRKLVVPPKKKWV